MRIRRCAALNMAPRIRPGPRFCGPDIPSKPQPERGRQYTFAFNCIGFGDADAHADRKKACQRGPDPDPAPGRPGRSEPCPRYLSAVTSSRTAAATARARAVRSTCAREDTVTFRLRTASLISTITVRSPV